MSTHDILRPAECRRIVHGTDADERGTRPVKRLLVPDPHVGPVLPLDTKTVTVHTIVDHQIVETIVNNRTAIVSYYPSIPTALALFGVVSGIEAEIKTWQLDAANNFAAGGGYGGRGYH